MTLNVSGFAPAGSKGDESSSVENSKHTVALNSNIQKNNLQQSGNRREELLDKDEKERQQLLSTDFSSASPKAIGGKKKKTKNRLVSHSVINIRVTANNTFVTITDAQGNVLNSRSAGSILNADGSHAFKGAKKATPYASGIVAKKCVEDASTAYSVVSADLRCHGVGPKMDNAIKSILDTKLSIGKIIDNTSIPHNGTRVKGQRTP